MTLLKKVSYHVLLSNFIKKIFFFLPWFLSVNHLKSLSAPNYPFLVAITVDTEPGYLKPNLDRVWQDTDNTAFVGYHAGIDNLLDLAKSEKIPLTFLLSTQCFSAEGGDRVKIIKSLKRLLREKHELGLHLHPKSDASLQKKLGVNVKATSAKFHSLEFQTRMLMESKKLIKEYLSKSVANSCKSFRWGNWALSDNSAKALQAAGFSIDSSAVPGMRGHQDDERSYDWSRLRTRYPFYLSSSSYRNSLDSDSKVLEIPIATFSLLGKIFQADPVFGWMLLRGFDKYFAKADRSSRPFVFVVMTHSSEMVYKNGSTTPYLKMISEFVRHTRKKKNVRFVTLQEAKSLFLEKKLNVR